MYDRYIVMCVCVARGGCGGIINIIITLVLYPCHCEGNLRVI